MGPLRPLSVFSVVENGDKLVICNVNYSIGIKLKASRWPAEAPGQMAQFDAVNLVVILLLQDRTAVKLQLF